MTIAWFAKERSDGPLEKHKRAFELRQQSCVCFCTPVEVVSNFASRDIGRFTPIDDVVVVVVLQDFNTSLTTSLRPLQKEGLRCFSWFITIMHVMFREHFQLS